MTQLLGLRTRRPRANENGTAGELYCSIVVPRPARGLAYFVPRRSMDARSIAKRDRERMNVELRPGISFRPWLALAPE